MFQRTENRVLVVEDDLIVRVDLAQAIELEGRDVCHVPSAEDALHVLEHDPSIGLVLTDIHMPGAMDGIQLAQHIRARWPDVRVVISSGNILTDARCQRVKATFLHKPYVLNELRKILAAA